MFGLAALMLSLSGVMLWRARSLPCPVDPILARACLRVLLMSLVLWCLALLCASRALCLRSCYRNVSKV